MLHRETRFSFAISDVIAFHVALTTYDSLNENNPVIFNIELMNHGDGWVDRIIICKNTGVWYWNMVSECVSFLAKSNQEKVDQSFKALQAVKK